VRDGRQCGRVLYSVAGELAPAWHKLTQSIDAHRLGLPLPRANYAVYPLADLTSTLKPPEERVSYDEAMAALSDEARAKVDALFAEPISTGHDLQCVANQSAAANSRAEDMSDLSGRMVWGHMVAA
jgi:hypothetical protein